MKKIMITGATGGLGGRVLELISEKADTSSLFTLARDPQKLAAFQEKGVTIVQGDYDDSASLVNAFTGIDVLYFVSGSDIVKRMQQHENVVNAAKEAGVKHVIYTSFQRKNETESSPIAPIASTHLKTENLLKESGMTYTILKHALYAEGIPMFLGEDVIERGVIYQPAGEGKTAFTSRADMAEAAVAILTTEEHENKTYEISVNASYTYGDVARILSEISGKEITYVSPTAEEFKKTMESAGVPPEIIGMVIMFGEGIRQGEFDFPKTTLERLIGRKPESMKEFLTKIYRK